MPAPLLEYDRLLAQDKPLETVAPAVATHLRQELHAYLAPLLTTLDSHLDARLVRTCAHTVEAILGLRHRQCGLLLSELGGCLLPPAHAPAGTKRLSHLLHSPKWSAALLTQWLWEQAQAQCAAATAAGERCLLIWDESVLEKPESQHLEGLGPVRSSKAARLTRPRPKAPNRQGCWQRPGPPVLVPGLHWLCLLLLGASGPPTVATMRWFRLPPKRKKPGEAPLTPAAQEAPETPPVPEDPAADPSSTRAEAAALALDTAEVPDLRTLQGALLAECVRRFGQRVVHVWDRGYAGSPWLGQVLAAGVRFVGRWPKRYHLQGPGGREVPAWQIARGQRAWGHRRLWDPRQRQHRRVGVLAFPVRHPDYAVPLWLVVVRRQGQHEPWYLLTNEAVHTEKDAWRVVYAYVRRWQIEQAFRYGKSELALESPRLWRWETRLKLLLLVTLAYGFLLRLLLRACRPVRQWLLDHYAPRTGHRQRAAVAPLYRLRLALSLLWQEQRRPYVPFNAPWPLALGPPGE